MPNPVPVTHFLAELFRPPVLGDEERTQRARTVHRVVLTATVIATVFMLVLILDQPSTVIRRAETILAVIALGLVVLEINRRGWTYAAGWLAVGGLVFVVAQRALTSGGITAPATTGGALPASEIVFTPLSVWIFNCLWLGFAIILQHQVAATLGASLERTRAGLRERQQAQQRLRLALDAGQIGVWDQNLATGRMTADQRLFELYGIPVPPDGSIGYETW